MMVQVLLCCSLLQSVAVCSSVLPSIGGGIMMVQLLLCCRELQCVAVSCSVLQCVAVCCCNVLQQCVALYWRRQHDGAVFVAVLCGRVWQCVAVCCSVLQCVAVCWHLQAAAL